MTLRKTVALALLASLTVLAVQAWGASRPPQPPGSTRVAEGHIPAVCTKAQGAAGAPSEASFLGVAYSARLKQWLSVPICYPRWGNLYASPSQVVKAGGEVTITAVPSEGSNSGTYAVETKSITWQFPGRRVRGCRSKDLTCTVVLAKKATSAWQWGEFHVSMPRTFFIDSPGSNCAGQHLCAGFATNAWAWAGVPPRGTFVMSGRVKTGCEKCHTVKGLEGVKVKAAGKRSESATTGPDGEYSMAVDDGRYVVTPSLADFAFAPRTRTVRVKGAAVSNVDFRTCTPPAAIRALRGPQTHWKGKTSCDDFDVYFTPNTDRPDGVNVTWIGSPAAPCGVTGAGSVNGQGGSVNPDGTFDIKIDIKRGTGVTITGDINGTVAFDAKKNATAITITSAHANIFKDAASCTMDFTAAPLKLAK